MTLSDDDVFSFGTFSKDEAREILSHYEPKTQSRNVAPTDLEEDEDGEDVNGFEEIVDELEEDVDEENETDQLANSLKLEEVVAETKWHPGVSLAEYFDQVNGETTQLNFPQLLAGLFNKGTTCYVNSVLQTLLRCPPFLRVLTVVECILQQGSATEFRQEYPLLCYLCDSLCAIKAWKQHNSLTAAVDIGELLQYLNQRDPNSEFYGRTLGTQHDAQELLQWLLDELDEEQRKVTQQSAREEVESEDSGWQEVSKGGKTGGEVIQVGEASDHERKSLIGRTFSGVLRSNLQKTGSKSNIVAQSFRSLQLDIQSKQVRTVTDALDLYFSPEYLDDGGIGQRQVGQMVVLVDVLPRVLVLHLKRFTYNPHTGAAEKITKPVSFTEEFTLNPHWFSPRLKKEQEIRQNSTSKEKRNKYRLFSAVYHHGKTIQAGHYISTVKDPCTGKWHRFDDQKVATAKCPVHNPEEVYLLFYTLS